MLLHVCVSVHGITPRPLRRGNRILKLDSQFQVSKGRKQQLLVYNTLTCIWEDEKEEEEEEDGLMNQYLQTNKPFECYNLSPRACQKRNLVRGT
jgi:hypothetical protein